ncbi:HNRNP arginine N-methyltransferase [Plectosphaerella plurivora]|uniref:type I protein arginine methyltransferase n=1 Tax=Plectosphaerella plurivora TaxID=936078 RepID=A0A9P8V5B7_9PEZI|nr:HNRNP arginine N-methyltransferase [Plectosphaerella plurivora]
MAAPSAAQKVAEVARSESSESSSGDEAEWLDAEPENEEPLTVVSLVDDAVFTDVRVMLDHCRKTTAFDFVAVRDKLNLDFYGTIKLVNFIRQRTLDGLPPPDTVTEADIEDDRYLKPVISDDAFIIMLDDIDAVPTAAEPAAAQSSSRDSLADLNAKLAAELENVTSQFANYRLAVEKTLEKRWGEDAQPSDGRPKDPSQYYWESYATNDIHETMLKDTIRTEAYRDFVYDNKHLFKGKVVLDIGCGTGILSMFCAKAGASKVIAVDKSDIIDKARENVFNNGLYDVISCIRGRIEDITLPVEHVDIIISEWMGYFLTYEAMLPSVLYARDKFLKPDGILVPSYSSIWVAPVSDPEFVSDHLSFWDDVYGFDMKAMKAGIYDDARVDIFPESTICGKPAQIAHFDLHTVNAKDLEFRTAWTSQIERPVENVDGFLIWFDVFFTTSRTQTVSPNVEAKPGGADKNRGLVTFTTSPFGTDTHWKQGFLHIDRTKGLVGPFGPATSISGVTEFKAPEDQPRALDITTEWSSDETAIRSQKWQLR